MTIKLRAPIGSASISIDGNNFTVDEKGVVIIPRDHLHIALEAGFKVVEVIETPAKDIEPSELKTSVEQKKADKKAK